MNSLRIVDILWLCVLCATFFLSKELPRFDRLISAKIGESRRISDKMGKKNRPNFYSNSTEIGKISAKSTKRGLFISHLRWWERKFTMGTPPCAAAISWVLQHFSSPRRGQGIVKMWSIVIKTLRRSGSLSFATP